VLIADSPDQLSEARLRLARVGIEDARGYLSGGVAAWKQAGFEPAELPQITVQTLHDRWQAHGSQVLDVRREPEWNAGHVAGATWWPLDNFKVSPPEIDRNLPIAVHCKSGYRSMIACSLLQRAGFRQVSNVMGGFDAWQQAKLPSVSTKPVGA
jgi:hydroxyacylglutathione hydrolase